ncbi:TPA: hypothetical protein DIT23_04375, partial [candidate division WOR-3 bacterium]|nr:hypothetical protein [candidate division WOR-3 bacterium]
AYVADYDYGVQIYRNLLSSGLNEKEIKGSEVKSDNYFIKYDVSKIELYFGASKESEMKLSIYDKTGRELKDLYKGKIGKGYSKLTINKGDYATGEYFIRGKMGETEVNIKILILK